MERFEAQALVTPKVTGCIQGLDRHPPERIAAAINKYLVPAYIAQLQRETETQGEKKGA